MRNKLTDVCQKMLDLLEHAQHYYTGPHKDEFGVIHEARALLAAQPAADAPSDMGQDDISQDCPHDTCDHAACQCAAPAPADRQEWIAPYVIDRSHPNQAYVTYGFSDEAECTQFIKATRYGSQPDRQGVALSDAELEDIYGWKGYTLDRFKREVRAILSRASSSRAEVGRMPLSEREAFEEWFRRNVNPNATMTRHPDDWPNNPGEYRSIITEDRWKTWLGRAEWVVEKPSVETLNRMAYILRLVPDGETVPGPMLLVLKDQYVAAMLAAAEAPNGDRS